MKTHTYLFHMPLMGLALLTGCNLSGHMLRVDENGEEQQAPDAERQDNDLETIQTRWSVVRQNAYGVAKQSGHTDNDADISSRVYEEQISAGKSEIWANAYASQIVAGKTPAEAAAFADAEEAKQPPQEGVSKTSAAHASSVAQHGSAGSHTGPAANAPTSAYHKAFYTALKNHSPEVAYRYAKVCEQQQHQKGKSEVVAAAYAKKLVLEGKTSKEAAAHAKELEESLTFIKGRSDIAAPGEMEAQSWQVRLLRKILIKADEPIAFAQGYVNNYETKTKEGKSKIWAGAYAMRIADGKSESSAEAFSDAYEEQRNLDESEMYAFIYATKFSECRDKALAKKFAGNYLSNYRKAPTGAKRSGYWRETYATAIYHGKSPAYARTFADAAEKKLESGKSKEFASFYASLIAAGQSEVVACKCAEISEEFKNIKSNEWLGACGAAIIQGKSKEFACTYANTQEAQLKEKKSKDWAGAYAWMIAQGKDPEVAETYALIYEMQLQEKKTESWARAYAAEIAEGRSPKEAEEKAKAATEAEALKKQALTSPDSYRPNAALPPTAGPSFPSQPSNTSPHENAFNQLDNPGYWYQASDIALIRAGGYLSGFSVICSDAANLNTAAHGAGTTRLGELIQQATANKPSLCIYNKGGNHWACFAIIDIKGQKVVFYKDSMGSAMDENLRNLLIMHGIEGQNIKVNHKTEQGVDSSHCGIFALENLSRIAGGLSGLPESYVDEFATIDFCTLAEAQKAKRGAYASLYLKGVVAQMRHESQFPYTPPAVVEYLWDCLELGQNTSKAVRERFKVFVRQTLEAFLARAV